MLLIYTMMQGMYHNEYSRDVGTRDYGCVLERCAWLRITAPHSTGTGIHLVSAILTKTKNGTKLKLEYTKYSQDRIAVALVQEADSMKQGHRNHQAI